MVLICLGVRCICTRHKANLWRTPPHVWRRVGESAGKSYQQVCLRDCISRRKLVVLDDDANKTSLGQYRMVIANSLQVSLVLRKQHPLGAWIDVRRRSKEM